MGYAHYVLAAGREAGYSVTDTCNHDDCGEEIDRGLGYLCGQWPGGEPYGCGGYFCGSHLYLGCIEDDDGTGLRWAPHTMCEPCLTAWKAAGGPTEDDEV